MSSSKVSKLFLSFGAALLAAHLLSVGCSSGGGGSKANRPVVEQTVPADATANHAINTILTAIFDDDMDPATIINTNFTLADTATSTAVTGTVTYHAPTKSATFVPDANLAADTNYTATITTGVMNTAGNALAAAFTWTFQTNALTDATAPTVTATNPTNGQIDVSVNTTITATFDEQMNIATIDGTSFTVTSGGSVAGTVTFNSTTFVATFTPSAPLQDNTTYTCTITTGAQDQAQNALAANEVWTFTTADNTAPSVVSGVPSNNAVDVALDATFSATFSEDMDPATLILDAGSVSINFNTVAFPGTVSYDAGTRTVTFDPDNNLSANTSYFFYVGTNATDVAGNALPLYTARFTTINDAVAPTVVDQYPPDTGNGPINTVITATFSEPIDPTTIESPATTFTVADTGGSVAGTVTYDVFSRTATFTPGAPLTVGLLHTVDLTGGIQDLAGNALVPVAWTFTTVAADAVAPTITAWTPADATADVSVASHQVIQFDEPMDRASVQGAFTVTSSVSGAPINPSQFFWNAAGDTVTVVFDTTSPVGIEADDLLDENADYTLQVGVGAQDLAGNSLADPGITWDTQDDITAPTIQSTVPADLLTATQSTAALATIVINFNETMDQTFVEVEMESESTVDERSADLATPDPDGDLTVTWTTATQLTLDFNVGTTGQPLLSNTRYMIELDVSDVAGNDLEEEELFVVLSGADAGNPSVMSNVPADGTSGVNPNSLALINFSRTMGPDIFDHISVSGNGATQYELEHLMDPPGVVIVPLQAWPGSSTITVTTAATASDASGNTLIGSHSFSFTTSAQTTNAWTLDTTYNPRKDGDTKVRTSLFEESFLFEDSAGNRVFMNEQTLAAEDVTLREQATGIPVKGFRLEAEEDGDLEVEDYDQVGASLQNSTTYELVFNSSLRNTHGIGITPTTLTFTTTDGVDTAPNHDWSDVEGLVIWDPAQPTVGIRILEFEVEASDDDGDALTVDAQGVQAAAFNEALTENPPASGEFEYNSAADETQLANGLNSFDFTIDDATNTVSFRRDTWNFGTNGVPRPTAPIGNGTTPATVPGGVPTYTFVVPSATRAAADILFLMVSEVDPITFEETPVLFTVLPTSATSFTHPFDTPLPLGDYVMCVGAANFASGVTRGDFYGFVIGATGFTPDFTVTASGSATSGGSQKAATPGRPSLDAWE